MPYKPARPCRHPGCPQLVSGSSGYCDRHRPQIQQQYDSQRGTAAQRGYDARWQKASKAYLAEHPLCVLCLNLKEQRIVVACEVHHVKPLALGGSNDETNLMALCKSCHSKITIRESGYNASNR